MGKCQATVIPYGGLYSSSGAHAHRAHSGATRARGAARRAPLAQGTVWGARLLPGLVMCVHEARTLYFAIQKAR
eukprot:scaffold88161_cov69-Phaeocystis_antarctica.AAC.4